ncbi:EthD domain-containing protein [Pseudonocardia thermophila]|jgi:hypothetical protein|uniref:EthD domain-containing protein n=1 Tax=Pseudonocardia thermophila TaxID=1848 RepID=A0A1M7ATM5_PSETH|nr:EthD domain-containing protein [Pseudonocardia thermophila]SHL46073.1 EthD domain-containing protein [Pseudonocardia thermophila]
MSDPMLSIVLARKPETTATALETALRAETETLRAAGWTATAAIAVEPDPFVGTAHGAAVPARVDALLSLHLPDPPPLAELAGVVADVAARLGDQIDPGRCAAVHGVEHTVIDGDGPLQISFALRRRPTMSHEQFSDYWLNTHGRMAKEAPRRKTRTGYRQLHADLDASRTIAQTAGLCRVAYDGLVSSDHVDAERMRKIFSHPAVAETALADERTFIDHRSSAIGLLRRLDG